MVQSIISKDIIANYLSTHYQIGNNSDSISLQINQYSESLARLLVTSKQSCASIISAYNPLSQLQSNEKNLTSHALLQKFLSDRSYTMIESFNIDPAKLWPTEKSFFVLGLDLNTSKSLGRQFNQNAIVWIGSNAIPQLILLR